MLTGYEVCLQSQLTAASWLLLFRDRFLSLLRLSCRRYLKALAEYLEGFRPSFRGPSTHENGLIPNDRREIGSPIEACPDSGRITCNPKLAKSWAAGNLWQKVLAG